MMDKLLYVCRLHVFLYGVTAIILLLQVSSQQIIFGKVITFIFDDHDTAHLHSR